MEALSPTSSSSDSSPYKRLDFSSLPIMPMRKNIVEKVLSNRVTLIVGETGCGKSSQVPQFLLDEGVWPVLCTQPRRFAVVAVANMVAMACDCDIGSEVGYHIGHSKHISESTKIVFKTAGVLLDEMRDKGSSALNYKVIILDEVHERSVESDLILACIKQFLLRKHDLRLVLMSATADISTYRDYFGDLDRNERVEVIAIPASKQQFIFQRRVFYLDQVTRMLKLPSDSLADRYCSGSIPPIAPADMLAAVHNLIFKLIAHIHTEEEDIEKSILVFLPTYVDLEQQWHRLIKLAGIFKVFILHSSVDTEQALAAMKIVKSHRKIILATNIAESSVTIPKVAYVIDSCRSLQVHWDAARQQDIPTLDWVSKSQAKQREGRTGRTCDGQIYRLVTRSFFGELKSYESPIIQQLSLRLQVLHICCAKSKAINDPKALLRKTMDPPHTEVVDDAVRMLTDAGALERASARSRLEPSFYGSLLASFSLSYDASVLVLIFGQLDYLREGILLGVLIDTQPLPILHPFGDKEKHLLYACSLYGRSGDNNPKMGRKEQILLGNLCAYQFWQRAFKDNLRLERLIHLLQKEDRTLPPSNEEEWCLSHNLLLSSLNRIAERYEEILGSLHRFRPDFFGTSACVPYKFEHACLVQTVKEDDDSESEKCLVEPFVDPSQFDLVNVARTFSRAINEIILHRSDNGDNDGSTLYAHFLRGAYISGGRTPCRFFSTLQGCRNGNSCPYSHVAAPNAAPSLLFCEAEEEAPDATSFLRLFPYPAEGFLLILDDKELRLSTTLSRYFAPSRIICTSSRPEAAEVDASLEKARILLGLRHPYVIIDGKNLIPWRRVQCILWFPHLDGTGDNSEEVLHLQQFFDFLALRMVADAMRDVNVVLTMNNIKFAQLQVEKLGRESFFYLKESFPFNQVTYGLLSDDVTGKRSKVCSRAVTYVFNMHPPSGAQHPRYATEIAHLLHSNTAF